MSTRQLITSHAWSETGKALYLWVKRLSVGKVECLVIDARGSYSASGSGRGRGRDLLSVGNAQAAWWRRYSIRKLGEVQ
jgi:hypothetical protein